MTIEELKRYDGHEGRAAYVAVNGIIYDVSNSPLWKEGNHVDTHHAGHDLTEELKSAPHVRTLIERFPVIGKIDAPIKPAKKKSVGIPLLSIIIMAFVMILLIATFML
ncbi:MAG: hypothetical protein OQK50_01245 [Deltaproteobacteria bacterium]|nr:hypothetical protein [Deltaproteobacteria bacterium]MCW8893329.1 hypothetical protein [Deltaproteobacteria bacterium]MCW9048939.1 hypothetical protein [Deltaproteobacteria bacterium]